MSRLAGKIAIVTGAAGGGGGGTGRAVAERMAAEGATVVVVDINDEGGEATAAAITEAGGKAVFRHTDLSIESDIIAVVDWTVAEYGGLDILFNCAFYLNYGQGRLADIDTEDWDKHYAVNIRGHFLFCKYAIPHLLKRPGGNIVNVASTSIVGGSDSDTAYATAKSALTTMTRYIATQYGKDGLRCNTIVPGLILTDANEAAAEDYPPMKAQFDALRANIAGPRSGRGYDIAAAACYLASDEAAYVNGTQLIVDGGMTAHNPEWAMLRALATPQ